MLFVGLGTASDFHLLILHQGDIHARYQTIDSFGITCANEDFQKDATCSGGFSRAVAYVKAMKQHPYTKNVLVVNSGDFFAGEMMHTLFKWKVSAQLARIMPYDALILGDKEFTDGLKGMLSFMRASRKKFVCTNMDFSQYNDTIRHELERRCPRHRVLIKGGKKIGILGYMTPRNLDSMKVPEIYIEDEIEALTREVAVLRGEGVKLFVALGHAGYERDQEVARRVPSLDVIVGGHSHTLLWPDPFSHQATGVPPDPMDAGRASGPYPTVVVQPSGRRVLLLHAFYGGKYIGNINVTFNADDEVKDWWPQPKLLTESMPEDPLAKAVTDHFQERMAENSQKVIGYSLVQLVGMIEMCYLEECNLGNLMTDAILWALRSYVPDIPLELPMIAFINGGLIRNNIQLGNVTQRMLTEALSWRNLVEVIVINGSTLLAALEHGVSAVEQRLGQFPQVSGITFHANLSRPPYQQRVSNVNVLCADRLVPYSQPLNLSHHYHVATTNYIADGGDGYHMFTQPVKRETFSILDIELLHHFIEQTSPVYAIVENRITLHMPPSDTWSEFGSRRTAAWGRSSRPAAAQHWLLLTAAVLLVSAAAATAAC